MVHGLDRGRTQAARLQDGLRGVLPRGEIEERHRGRLGLGNEPHGDVGHDAQRALGAHDQAHRVEPGLDGADLIAGSPGAPQIETTRILVGSRALGEERRSALAEDVRQLGGEFVPRSPFTTTPRVRAQSRHAPVVEHDGHAQHVVLRRAVPQRVRARGVRADVPADRAEIAARGIRSEPEPHPARRLLHAGVDGARLHPHRPPIRVDVHHPVHVRGEIQDDPRAQSLAREAGPSSPGRDGHACGGRVLNDPGYIGLVPWRDDGEGLAAEDAGCRGEERERDGIGAQVVPGGQIVGFW